MTDRKKKGIGFLVSGLVTAGVGAVLISVGITPDWVTTGLVVIGAIGNALGFAFVFPDVEKQIEK